MIAKIIPLLKLPPRFTFLDYLVPKELEDKVAIGEIVKIPFRSREEQGIIFDLQNFSDFPINKLKSLEKFSSCEITLPQWEVELLKKISDYYLLPIGNLARLYLPSMPKKTNKKQTTKNSQHFPKLCDLLQNQTAPQIDGGKTNLIIYSNVLEKVKLILTICQETLKENQSILLIKETQEAAKDLYFLISHFEPEKTILLIKSQNKSKEATTFKIINSNAPLIIIGGRNALFAPLPNLGAVIIDEYQNEFHKQTEQNPKIDNRVAAKYIQELTGRPLYLFSVAPQIKNASQEINPITLNPGNQDILEIVDLNQESRAGNFKPISIRLYEEMEHALENKKQILLFTSKKALATAIKCQDCQYLFVCSSCGKPLVGIEKGFICSHCKISFPKSTECPKCGGFNLRYKGFGLDKIAEIIKKEFPDKKLLALQPTPNKKYNSLENLSEYDIILASHYALSRKLALLELDIGLVGALFLDNLFYFSGFNSKEKILNLILDLETIARTKNCPFLWQTYTTENPLVEIIRNKNFDKFTQNELKERKIFRYPPFSQIIKLTYKYSNFDEFGKLKNKLSAIKNAEIMARNNVIIIKLLDKASREAVFKVLRETADANWQIEIDAENLL